MTKQHTPPLSPDDPMAMLEKLLADQASPEEFTRQLFALNLTQAQEQSILEASNCKSLIDRLTQGLDTLLTEGGASISSGERQLISIARAFARNPQLILFDEATSYIDSPTELRIQQALEKLMQNRTSLVVAHRLSTVRHADRIIVLNRGRIIETGNHTDLMQQKGFYFRLHQLQNKNE